MQSKVGCLAIDLLRGMPGTQGCLRDAAACWTVLAASAASIRQGIALALQGLQTGCPKVCKEHEGAFLCNHLHLKAFINLTFVRLHINMLVLFNNVMKPFQQNFLQLAGAPS